MQFSLSTFALFAVGASAAALAPRENYGTWNVHVHEPVCHVTYGCRQTFDIDGKGGNPEGRPSILFAGCALGAGCTVDIGSPDGALAYTLIHRVDEPEKGQLTVTQTYWDETNEYNASGTTAFTGDAGEYTITITDVTSTPK